MVPSYHLDQCWNIVNWNLRNKFQSNLKWNSYIFIQENAFPNVVCEMAAILCRPQWVNTLRPEHNGCHLADIFKGIFWNENFCILIQFSLNLVIRTQWSQHFHKSSLVQVMAWCQTGTKPLPKTMVMKMPYSVNGPATHNELNSWPEIYHKIVHLSFILVTLCLFSCCM